MKDKVLKCFVITADANADFLIVLITYALIAFIASRALNFSIDFGLYGFAFILLCLAITVILFAFYTMKMILVDKPTRPVSHLWHSKVRNDWAMAERMLVGVPAAISIVIFFSIFTSVKESINRIIPFYADPYLAGADKFLMGDDAWRIFHALLGLPVVTFALSFFYNLWFFVMITAVFYTTFMLNDFKLRSRYLVAFVLTLAILGNVLAIMFSSVGPCYYQNFYGQPRYADLMAYLHLANHSFPIWSLAAQNYLLHANNAGPHFGAGISAFPSVHLAIAMLNVMLCLNLGRKLSVASIVFLVLILVGSVQLGWHYAVDGYFSIIGVPIIWWVAGKISLANFAKRLTFRTGLDLHKPAEAFAPRTVEAPSEINDVHQN